MTLEQLNVRLQARCVRAASGCLEFQGFKCWQGYGRMRWRGRTWLTHRLALSVFLGRVLHRNEVVGHRCNNPRCCEPEHLYLTTFGENQAHAYRDGLRSRNRPKLSTADVHELRQLAAAGWTRSALSFYFGVSTTTAHRIIHRTKWRNV